MSFTYINSVGAPDGYHKSPPRALRGSGGVRDRRNQTTKSLLTHSSGYVVLGQKANIANIDNSFSVVFWFYPNSSASNFNTKVINLGYREGVTDSENSGLLFQVSNTGEIIFRIDQDTTEGHNGAFNGNWKTGLLVTPNMWNLVVCKRNPYDASCHVRNADGIIEATTPVMYGDLGLWENRYNHLMGYNNSTDQETPAIKSTTDNKVDLISVYKREINHLEVDALWGNGIGVNIHKDPYHQAVVNKDPIRYYRMDDKEGTICQNRSMWRGRDHGSYIGDVTLLNGEIRGGGGSSVVFNQDSYMEADGLPNTTNGVVIEMWGSKGCSVSTNMDETTSFGVTVDFNADGVITAFGGMGLPHGDSGNPFIVANDVFDDDLVHHIIVRYHSNNSQVIYVDGDVVAFTRTGTTTGTPVFADNGNVTINKFFNENGLVNYSGVVGDVVIYDGGNGTFSNTWAEDNNFKGVGGVVIDSVNAQSNIKMVSSGEPVRGMYINGPDFQRDIKMVSSGEPVRGMYINATEKISDIIMGGVGVPLASYASIATNTSTATMHLSFDETSGTSVSDYTNKTPHANIYGGVTLGHTPLITGGYSALFDGIDGYVTGSNITTSGDMSVSCWVKTTANSFQTIASKMDITSSHRGWRLDMNANGTVEFRTKNGNVNDTFSSGTSTSAINDGEIHYIEAYIVGSTYYIYVDGDVESSGSGSTASKNTSVGVTIGALNSQALYGGIGASDFFSGYIDEFTLYNNDQSAMQRQFKYIRGTV